MNDPTLPASNECDEVDPPPPVCTGAPEQIYLVVGDIEQDCTFGELTEVTWCTSAQYDADVKYVRADLLDEALAMLADWCVRVDMRGTGWDDWDEAYKDAMYRPSIIRERLNKAIAEWRKAYE